jgi:2-iminobutanoate/2-iminopropanoate deaminase
MQKRLVTSPQAPPAMGAYSPAIRAGNLLFVSGQIPIDPSTGNLIDAKDIQSQTRRVLQNLQALVTAAGGTLDNVVRTTVFLKDMNDFAGMNTVYSEFFSATPPARATVEGVFRVLPSKPLSPADVQAKGRGVPGFFA